MALTDPDSGETNQNPNYDEERYAYWLQQAREAYKAAAPYYAPKLHSVVANVAITDDKRSDLNPRQRLLEAYFAMRRRGELTSKLIEGPKDVTPAGNGMEAVEAVVIVEEGRVLPL
jgi:hypothetical protein